jgi:hypothetical protein
MKNTFIKLFICAILLTCHLELFAQSSDCTIFVSYILVADENAPFVFKDGKYVPGENSKPSGELSMVLKLDGKEYPFTFSVTGTSDSNDEVLYECDYAKYFYVKNNNAYPYTEDIASLDYSNLSEAIEAFRTEKSKGIAWTIWVLHTAKGGVNEN